MTQNNKNWYCFTCKQLKDNKNCEKCNKENASISQWTYCTYQKDYDPKNKMCSKLIKIITNKGTVELYGTDKDGDPICPENHDQNRERERAKMVSTGNLRE